MTDQTVESAPRTAAALAAYEAERADRTQSGWGGLGIASIELVDALQEERVLERLVAAETVLAAALAHWQRCLEDTACSAADGLGEIANVLREYYARAKPEGGRDATN